MEDFDRKKLMYFQFSSHLLLFAWRLPPPTGKKDFFRCGYDDDDDDDDNGDEKLTLEDQPGPRAGQTDPVEDLHFGFSVSSPLPAAAGTGHPDQQTSQNQN